MSSMSPYFEQDLHFSEQDKSITTKVLAHHSTPHVKLTLQYLFKRWSQLVNHSEEGYLLTLDDYTNDLWSRDLLQFVDVALSDEGQYILKSVLTPLDDRFIRATRTISRPLLTGTPFSPQPFWWYRIPIDIRREEFIYALKAQRLIDE